MNCPICGAYVTTGHRCPERGPTGFISTSYSTEIMSLKAVIEQLKADHKQALAKAYQRGLEDAAKICESFIFGKPFPVGSYERCADAIRAAKPEENLK